MHHQQKRNKKTGNRHDISGKKTQQYVY